jgi:flagella basal body P-ring formation protein FlgA
MQKHKSARIFILCTIVTFTLLFWISVGSETVNGEVLKHQATKPSVQIHLPREIKIKDQTLSLEQIAVVRGDESLVAKANEIVLGQFSMPGQEIVIDRSTILSRLVCNGINASKVTLTGAEKIMVKRQQKVVGGCEFVEIARSFFMKNLPTGSICSVNPMVIPKDLFVSETNKNIKLVPSMIGNASKSCARVKIAVFADGKQIGTRKVTLRLKYNCRRAVTLVELDAGKILSPENIKIEKVASNYPEPLNWSAPYGLVTRCLIDANTVIQPGMISSVKPQVLLKRHKTVLIRFEKPGLLVTAVGKTMQKGSLGEYIKVRNIDSQRIILAKVKEDGTVEPVF